MFSSLNWSSPCREIKKSSKAQTLLNGVQLVCVNYFALLKHLSLRRETLCVTCNKSPCSSLSLVLMLCLVLCPVHRLKYCTTSWSFSTTPLPPTLQETRSSLNRPLNSSISSWKRLEWMPHLGLKNSKITPGNKTKNKTRKERKATWLCF